MGLVSVTDVQLLARAQHAVDELTADRTRVEVLDGMVVVNPPPSVEHGRIIAKLYQQFVAWVPAGLQVDAFSTGVYEKDDPEAEYQQPDVTVHRTHRDAARIVGIDVELVVEVVSPSNRRHRDYEAAIVTRAVRYQIPWVLIVDPASRTTRWWHHGTETATGPNWAGMITPWI